MDWSTLYKALHEWAQDSTGIDAVWDNASAPRRTYPLLVLDVESVTPVGPDWFESVEQDGREIGCVLGRRTIRLNVQAYTQDMRPDADGRYFLERASMSLRLPRFREALSEVGLALIQFQPAIEIDTELNGEYKSRWTQDFLFNAVVSQAYPEDLFSTIESTEVTNEGTDPDTVFTAP